MAKKSKLKSKATKLLIKVSAPVMAVMAVAGVIYSFGSGLAITDYTLGTDKRRTAAMQLVSPERELLDELVKGEDESTEEGIDEEYLNNMYFTRDNFKMILEQILAVKESRKQRDTLINYEYYYETWGKHYEPVSTEWNEAGEPYLVYDWVWRWTDDVGTDSIEWHATDIEDSMEFDLNWQTIYALLEIASIGENEDWQNSMNEETEKLLIEQRLDKSVVQAAINLFTTNFIYNYDAAAAKRVKYVTTDNYNKIPNGIDRDSIIESSETLIDGTLGEITTNTYSWYEAGTLDLKWTGGRNGGNAFEDISYYVQTYDEGGPLPKCQEGVEPGPNLLKNGVDFWEFQPPESDEWNGYTRVMKKIPATSLAMASNGFESWNYYYEDNTVETPKYHYKYSDYCVRSGEVSTWCEPAHGGENNQIKEMVNYADVMKFYEACIMIAPNFEWEWFLQILETLPANNGDEAEKQRLIERYENMFEEWKHYVGPDKLENKKAPDDIYYINDFLGENVIYGYKLKEAQQDHSIEDKYLTPYFGEYSEDEEITRPLNVPDNISREDLINFFKSYPAIICRDSVFLEDPEGMADAVLKVQETYGVSGLGLLAIAANESGWGGSNNAKTKHNYIGWQAYDRDPSMAATFGSDAAAALYDCLSLIARHYVLRTTYHSGPSERDQDSYYKMRYNRDMNGNPYHEYCTSDTWVGDNAKIRASFEKWFGLRGTDEDYSVDRSYVLVGEKTFTIPVNYTRISSPFGARLVKDKDGNVVEGASTDHKGVDLAAPQGTPIVACADGVVYEVVYGAQTGYGVRLEHGAWINGEPTYTVYYHMCRESSWLHKGDMVRAGEIIGYVGNTGVSTGPHLHFAVYTGSLDKQDAKDPQAVFGF